MKYARGQRGFVSSSVIELMVAAAVTLFLLSWIAGPIRASFATNNLLSYEMQQRQVSQLLNPVIEDIREAQAVSIAWPYLNPAVPASYNPTNFPWFTIPNGVTPSSPFYVCYYYDTSAQTLWRVQTNTMPTNMTTCDRNVSGSSTKSIATGVMVPTASQPLFRGDVGTKSVYIKLSIALPSSSNNAAGVLPQSLTVVRIATPRN
jgi:hypothetical protein